MKSSIKVEKKDFETEKYLTNESQTEPERQQKDREV